LLVPRPTTKPEDHPLSAVRDCLFNIFAATLHPQPEDAPCRGERDPLAKERVGSRVLKKGAVKGSKTVPRRVQY